MKTIFLTVCSIIFFACSGLINAQVDTVYLNEDEANLVEPGSFKVDLSPGDSIIFVSKGGDFAIRIPNALQFLVIGDVDLEIKVIQGTPSEIFVVSSDIDGYIDRVYTVYSIGNDEWPEAPPRIVIK